MKLSIFVAVLWLAAPAGATGQTVLVLPLTPVEVEVATAEGVGAMVESAANDLGDWRVLPLSRRLQKMLSRCDGADAPCLAKVGDARGVDAVLAGSVRGRPDGLELSLFAIDVEGAEILARSAVLLSGGEVAMQAGARRVVVQLLAPERYVGSLSVDCNVKGARVVVDGSPRGLTPLLGALTGLSAGLHSLRVERAGYQVYDREVAVRFNDTVHVQVTLLRREDLSTQDLAEIEAQERGPWRPGIEPWGWVITGAGAAFLVAGLGTGIAALVQSGEVERRASAQVLTFPHDQATVERGRLLAVLANGFYATGALVAAGGLTLGIWDVLVPAPPRARPLAAPVDDAEIPDNWDAEVLHVEESPSPGEGDVAPADKPTALDAAEPESDLPEGDTLPEGDL